MGYEAGCGWRDDYESGLMIEPDAWDTGYAGLYAGGDWAICEGPLGWRFDEV